MGRHYLSDVAAGLALGLVTASLVTQARERLGSARARSRLHTLFCCTPQRDAGSTCKRCLQNCRGRCTQWAAGSRGRRRRARMQGQCRRWRAGCQAWTSVRWGEAVCGDTPCLARRARCNTGAVQPFSAPPTRLCLCCPRGRQACYHSHPAAWPCARPPALTQRKSKSLHTITRPGRQAAPAFYPCVSKTSPSQTRPRSARQFSAWESAQPGGRGLATSMYAARQCTPNRINKSSATR